MTNKQQQTLRLPRPLVNRLLAHAQQNPEVEICGLIGCDDKHNKQYYPVKNIANNPTCRFLMDAPQQIAAMKKMRENNQTLFAIVHSHPTAKAMPSLRDRNENTYPDAYYIITSLNTEGVLEMRAFITLDNRMQEIELILDTE